MKTLAENETIEELIRQYDLAVFQFSAKACKPCLAITHRLDAWQLTHPTVLLRKIDVEENPAVSAQHNVMTVPTVAVYAQGRLSMTKSGYFSLDEMLMRLDEYLELLN